MAAAGALVVGIATPAAAGTITFTSDRCAGDPNSECRDGIWLIGDDGTGLRRLNVPNPPEHSTDVDPTWSPDGREIAHMRFQPSGLGIWATAADGSASRQLVSTPSDVLRHVEDPVWSPDGRFVAFAGRPAVDERPAGGPFVESIYVVPAAGGPVRRLTSGFLDGRPVWTPDSQRVVFSRNGPPTVPTHYSSPIGFFSVPIDDGPLAKVFLGGPLGEPDPQSFAFATAQIGFAPDGRSIAVASLGRIYLASGETGEMTEVTTEHTGDGNITLSWAWEARPRLVIASAPYYTGNLPPLGILDVSRPGLPLVPLTRDYPDGKPAGDTQPDWNPALGVRPAVDVTPPVVQLTLGAPPVATARSAAAPRRVSKRSFALRAADSSGIRRVEAVFGREVSKRVRVRRCGRRAGVAPGRCRRVARRRTVCRFATRRSMSRKRSCGRRITLKLDSAAQLKRVVTRLPRGRYRMRLRVRDVYGRAAGPRPRRITLVR